MKGRIVYRGDCAKDEDGGAAVYRELGANPTSVQGLIACMVYGALPGNSTTTANVRKAYVQAYLKSNFQTWIELPPEFRSTWWREKFARPVVLLLRALYGHPEAGGLWEQHLTVVLRTMGGNELLVSQTAPHAYVAYDLTLSDPEEEHQAFCAELTLLVHEQPPPFHTSPHFKISSR